MNKKCTGCGAILQDTNPDNIGYIPKNKLETATYCQRCYKIKYYNQKSITILDNINDTILKKVNNKKNIFVYFLIDFINISQEVLDTYNSIKAEKCFVISKTDTIPPYIKKEKLINNLKDIYNIKEEIILLSSLKNLNVKSILWRLNDKGYKEGFIVGYANSGKSSLINKICDTFGIEGTSITTSSAPNTTVDFIKIKVEDLTIYDSPGFVYNSYFYNPGEFELIKRCSPKPPLKPITYQLKSIASILIEDRVRISSSINNNLTLYSSNNIIIDKVYDNNKKLLDANKIELDIPNNSDLIIKGLGFINIKKECKLTIYSLNKDIFEIRESVFK
jgi:hypothetical protein